MRNGKTLWRMVINAISSNFKANFIKRYLIELKPGACLLYHNSSGMLECKSAKQVFSVLQLFKYVKSFRNILQSFSVYWLLFTYIYCQLIWIQFLQKKQFLVSRILLQLILFASVEIYFGIFLVVKFRYKEMSDLPKVENYEVKIRLKNYDLPKASKVA